MWKILMFEISAKNGFCDVILVVPVPETYILVSQLLRYVPWFTR